MDMASVIRILGENPVPFAIGASLVLIFCFIIRHEYGTRGVVITFAFFLFGALPPLVENAIGAWAARVYAIAWNATVVFAIVLWLRRGAARERRRLPEKSHSPCLWSKRETQ